MVHRITEFLATPGITIYLVSLVVMGGLATLEIVRGKGSRAFAWVVAIVLVAIAFRFGQDFLHHLYRIDLLAEQVRSGTPSLLVTNPATGEALPLFVYYSFVPYLPAVALQLAGLPAHVAMRLTMALALVILALGLTRLIRLNRHSEDTSAAFLGAILFLCANYVHNLWVVRQAYAEIGVYCLIPWVTLALLQRREIVPLTALLFLQITGHPLVFAQAFGCALLIALSLTNEAPVKILTRYAVATIIALVLATPFWLPQVLWRSLILGPTVLARFADGFLSFGDVVNGFHAQGMGYALPTALILTVAWSRGRLPARAWMLLVAVLALVAIQTRPLIPIAERLPLLSTSLFVSRLMLPAALLAFALLLVAWKPQRTRNTVLAGLTLLSLATLEVALAVRAPPHLRALETFSEAEWIRGYRLEHGWGRIEFLPNYAALPQRCVEAQKVSFADLRHGVHAISAYIAIPAAPLGGVDYSVDSKPAPLAACDDALVIGPVTPGADVRVSDATLILVLYARLGALAICVIGWLAWMYAAGGQSGRGRGGGASGKDSPDTSSLGNGRRLAP